MTADAATIPDSWTSELFEFLRIPSISAEPEHAESVRAAAQWVVDFLNRAGGTAEIIEGHEGRPVVVGELAASEPSAATGTVIVYGHFDVQPPGESAAWESPPFSPEIRDGWIRGRGAADDKGCLYCLLKAAALLSAEGRLPVNVRVLCDGEEEILGTSIIEIIRDGEPADACLIFDGLMPSKGMPAFALGSRGLLFFHLSVRTGMRELHSGHFGGTALNAVRVLSEILAPLGRLEKEMIGEARAPATEELADWAKLKPGSTVLGALDVAPRVSDAQFYTRRFACPAIDINGIRGGEAALLRTVIPCLAEANVSVRLAPGQDVEETSERIEACIRAGLPDGATLTLERWSAIPAAVMPAQDEAIGMARDAFARVAGRQPILVRTGGTLPVMSALAAKGIPTILTGLDVPEGNVHAPNEGLLLDHLRLGIEAASAMLTAFGALRRSPG